jgi:hypothetical protein
MTERQIHDQFIAWLRKNEVPYSHHRMDSKSGIQKGWPDFTVLWMSRVVCIEVKTSKGRVSKDQERVIAFIRKSGNRVEICRSCEECVEAVKNILCESKLDVGGTPVQSELPKKAVLPGDGNKLFIGIWEGQEAVFVRQPDGSALFMHVADVNDAAMLPRL